MKRRWKWQGQKDRHITQIDALTSREEGDECITAGPPMSEREAPGLAMPPTTSGSQPQRGPGCGLVRRPQSQARMRTHGNLVWTLPLFFSALVTERHLNESQPRDASPCDWHRGRTASAVSDAGARGTVVDSLSGVVFFLGRKFSSLLPRTEAITPVPCPQ